jgi:predicted nucleic acid-binding protein
LKTGPSPLILLDFLGYASLLPGLYEVFIPPRVAEELTVRPGDAGSKLPEEPWVHQQAPNPLTLERVSRELATDPGEESAVALAVDLSALVVLDELKARAYARRLKLPLTGTLGIVVRLHRLGLNIRPLETELDQLEARGMWMTPDLRRDVLKRMAENGT